MTELLQTIHDHFYDSLGIYMFLTLVLLMFTGFPVAYALGGTATIFGGLAILLGIIEPTSMFLLVNRIWGGAGMDGVGIVHNYALVVIPLFLFMGTLLENRVLQMTCCWYCR